MSNGPNRVFDELAKLMTDAAGAAQGVRREVEGAFKSQGERFLNSMDLVKREEFDAVMEMAAKAREDNALLATRLNALEARLVALEGADAPAVAEKSASKSKKAK